jgi:electron transport complex protein RnfC
MRVTRGELIADAPGYVGMRIHAPTSGTITAIGEFPVVHPSGLPAAAIVLTPDGLDEAGAGVAAVDPASVSATEIFERIAAAGIVGLGGAGFPAHVKVQEGETQQVDTLIVNAVECEPYICCDDRVAREAPAEIVGGAALLARAMNARECVIAVEDDMPEAHALLAQAAGDAITVVSVPAVYPAGGEKQLITVLTGKEVPSGLLPIHVGVAVLNVQTVRAIYHAVTAGTPLIERMVTVAGDIADAGNFNVLTGTPVRHVLQHTGAMPLGRRFVVSGGPMMGTRVGNIEAPVTKTVNCLLVRDEPAEAPAPLPCIRCGETASTAVAALMCVRAGSRWFSITGTRNRQSKRLTAIALKRTTRVPAIRRVPAEWQRATSTPPILWWRLPTSRVWMTIGSNANSTPCCRGHGQSVVRRTKHDYQWRARAWLNNSPC